MRHVYVSDENKYALVEAPEPKILEPTDIIVKVRTTTVCGSDVHLLAGHMHTPWGFPLGHECVGTVHEVGAAIRRLKVGDSVAVPAAPWCGTCDNCRRGQIQACLHTGVFGSGKAFGNLDGAMAEYVRVPGADACVSIIPAGVTDAQALTVGDILATGWTATRNAVTAPGQTLLVFGAGPVGLAAIHTARLYGVARAIAVDTIPERLELARKMGADHTIDASREDVAGVVAKLTGGRGAEAVVDAAGAKATIDSWPVVGAVGGRVAVVAIPGAPVEINLGMMLFKNISLWTGLGDLGKMDMLLGLIAAGKLDPSPIFTETLPFDRIETAIAEFMARKPGLVKPLITLS